uniref:Protein kinase domain-containing protein n=1 Tax=Anisakis simplex TaxID=6269 RepID=A0A0M3K9B5_ANISI
LIAYHSRNNLPLSADQICIKNGVEKSEWQLFHEQVEKTRKLGEGAFGEVWEGTLSLGVFRGRIPVAIKTLHSSAISTDERIKFLREANLMLKLNHPTETDRVKYCSDIASGLAYLEMMCVIHRDVAARNCLLGEEETVKLSDFGLSLLGIEYREKHMKNVPIRWLAPETLKGGRYSTKTDVWSFGVTMWEIFSDGAHPYGDIEDNREIRHGVLEQRLKLNDPIGMPAEILEVMHGCLLFQAELRPPFHELAKTLEIQKDARLRKNRLSAILHGILHI